MVKHFNSTQRGKWKFTKSRINGADLQPIDFAQFARACGAKGFTIEDPEACSRIVEQALAESGPFMS